MSVRPLTISLSLLTGAAALMPRAALACSGTVCEAPTMTPASGPVPPDLAALMLSGVPAGSTSLTVRELAWPNGVVASATELKAHGTLAFDRALVAGRRYTVESSYTCESRPVIVKTAEWTVEAASTAPKSLPALKLVASGVRSSQVAVNTGGCVGWQGVRYATLELDLSALSPGYRNALQDVQLLVNGHPYAQPIDPPEPYDLDGPDAPAPDPLLPTRRLELERGLSCDDEADAGVANPGKYSVQARATVPSKVPYQIESPAIEVDVPCLPLPKQDAGPYVPDDGGAVLVDASTATDSGGTVQTTRSQLDAGAPPQAGSSDDQRFIPLPDDGHDSSAGCALGAGRSAASVSWWLALLGLAVARVRARRKQ